MNTKISRKKGAILMILGIFVILGTSVAGYAHGQSIFSTVARAISVILIPAGLFHCYATETNTNYLKVLGITIVIIIAAYALGEYLRRLI